MESTLAWFWGGPYWLGHIVWTMAVSGACAEASQTSSAGLLSLHFRDIPFKAIP